MAQTAAKAMIAAALLVVVIPTPSHSQAASGKGQTGSQGTSGKCNAPGQIKKGASGCDQTSGGAAGGDQGSGSEQGSTGPGSTTAGGTQGAGSSGSAESGGAQGTTAGGSTAAGGAHGAGSYGGGAESGGAPSGYGYNEQGGGYGYGLSSSPSGYGQAGSYSSNYGPQGGTYYPQPSWSAYQQPRWREYAQPTWGYYSQSGWNDYQRPSWSAYQVQPMQHFARGRPVRWRLRWGWRPFLAAAGVTTAAVYGYGYNNYRYGVYGSAAYDRPEAYTVTSNYSDAALSNYNYGYGTDSRYGNYYDSYSQPSVGAEFETAAPPAPAVTRNYRSHSRGYRAASAGWTKAYCVNAVHEKLAVSGAEASKETLRDAVIRCMRRGPMAIVG